MGITVNLLHEIVLPCVKHSQPVLAYFDSDGGFVGNAYLPEGVLAQDLAVTKKNEVLVADSANSVIHFVHERRRSVRALAIPRAHGDREKPVPGGLCVNAKDELIVTDTANNNVKIFNAASGELQHCFGSAGSRPGQFLQPLGLCVDKQDRILVADTGNKRVQMFDFEGKFLHFIVR